MGLKKGKKVLKKRIAASGTYPSTCPAAKKVAYFICVTTVRCRMGMCSSPFHELQTVRTGGSQKTPCIVKKRNCFILVSNK